MTTVWIIGAGKFGRLAVKRLGKTATLHVVDKEKKNLDRISRQGIQTTCSDGIRFVVKHLHILTDTDWIIPLLPLHLAWEWCRLAIGPDRLIPHTLPPGINACLPNPMQGGKGVLYTSHADFICPDNCNEPDQVCTKTGKPRKQDMHELIAQIKYRDYTSVVIKSRQLAPGVGGYRPVDLLGLRDTVLASKGPLLVSTACRCHAVVTAAFRK